MKRIISFVIIILSYNTAFTQTNDECENQHINRVNAIGEEHGRKWDNVRSYYEPLKNQAFEQGDDDRFNALNKAEDDAYNAIRRETESKVDASHNERERCLGSVAQRKQRETQQPRTEQKNTAPKTQKPAPNPTNRGTGVVSSGVPSRDFYRKQAEAQREWNAERARIEVEQQREIINASVQVSRAGTDLMVGLVENNANSNDLLNSGTTLDKAMAGKKGQTVIASTGGRSDRPKKAIVLSNLVPKEVIGEYKGEPVYKKEDSILVEANNKKYLLSKQTLIMQGDSTYYFIPANSFIVAKEIQGNEIPIGYISTTSQMSNSTLYGEQERFAKNASGYKFHEFTCDTATYNKFIQFCNWQICKQTNTANVSQLSYVEYDKIIKEDIALNNKIIMLNLQDIITSISSSMISDLTNGVFDMNTSLRDVTMKSVMNFATENKITGQVGACANTALNTVEKALNQQYKDLTTITVKDIINGNSQEIRNMYKTEFQKSVEDAYHTLFDLLDDCNSNMSKKLIVYKILPEIVNVGMMSAANTTIKFSVAPEYKNSLKSNIEKAKKKKEILEKGKQEYEQKIKKASDNCLEYTKTINSLKSGLFEQQYGSDELDEITILMKDYVFGNKNIGICNILKNNDSREKTKKKPQPIKDVNPNRIAIFVHGTKSKPTMWVENSETVTTLLEIVNTQRCDAKFSWENDAVLSNTYFERKKAAEHLADYVSKYRGKYEEVVIIAHSHGGNVALQAIDKLVGFKKIYLLTLNTPAFNKDEITYDNKDKVISTTNNNPYYEGIPITQYEKITKINKENPKNINNLYMHIQVANNRDWVSPYFASLVKSGYDRHFTHNKTKKITIDCDAKAFDHSIQLSDECLEIIKQKISNYFKNNQINNL